MDELPIIQKTYDLLQYYIPILNRLPRDWKYNLGDRIINRLYDFLETLLTAQFQKDKLAQLTHLNASLTVLRYQARLLLDFQLINLKRYEYLITKLDDVGTDLGAWIKHQQRKANSHETLR